MSIYNNTSSPDQSIDSIYYVYQYLRENGIPYYVGKGKGNRAYAPHRVPVLTDKSRIEIVKTNLTNKEALKLEIDLITKYGRKDIGTGVLHNLIDGGTGGDTSYSPNYKLGIAKRDYKGSKNPNFGKPRSAETIALIKKNQPSTKGKNNGMAKSWKITSPYNDVFYITGTLKAFCKEHKLSYSGMTLIGKTGIASTKGKNVGWSIIPLV